MWKTSTTYPGELLPSCAHSTDLDGSIVQFRLISSVYVITSLRGQRNHSLPVCFALGKGTFFGISETEHLKMIGFLKKLWKTIGQFSNWNGVCPTPKKMAKGRKMAKPTCTEPTRKMATTAH